MVRWIPLALVVVPLVELYLLLVLGRWIGLGPTVALTIVTGLVGSVMARLEGLRVWRDWLRSLRELRSPAQSLLEGVLVLVGGALLITPGVLTDAAGFLLLLPPTRRALARPLRRAVEAHIAQAGRRIIHRRAGGNRKADGVVDTSGESVDDAESSSRGEAPRLPGA